MALVDFLDPTVLAILEQPQPYNMSQPMEHALAELNKLANLDKQGGVRAVTARTRRSNSLLAMRDIRTWRMALPSGR
ncbi:hypothetical protein [Mycobacterium riyadhense]|uniref:Uncharacterized protein n=1 Tax=Mycobacterium riyadhense TaxID=486698 RepID=A0A653EXE2_9MYCO|nr:hypothetical protein [Mycobacterium riyadhense]VTP02058.1 hypothetical protein BIN_B_04343 [Mycobacterium riyadhense]